MTAEGAHPRWEDQIVADYGDGYDVQAIAARYGLTVEQVYAVVQGEVGSPEQPPPGYPPPPPGWPAPSPHAPSPPGHPAPPPPGYSAPPPGHVVPPPTVVDVEAIVGAFAGGHPVEAIAQRHGLTVQQIYEVIHWDVTQNP